MATARRVSVEITAQDRTGAAFQSVAGKFGGLQQQIAGLAAGFSGVQAAFAATLGGAGLGALVTGVADSLDAINDLSDATGASVANVSRLESAVRRTGGSFEDASALLVKFNQALAAADAGSDQARVFDALGLSVAALRKADPVDALLQTAQAFQRFGNSGELARAQVQLLGKSIATLAPVFKDLAEDGAQFGAVTEEQAAAADAFNKALARVRTASQDAARSAVSDLLPALNVVLDALGKGGEQASAFSAAGTALRLTFEALTVLGANVAFVFTGVGREIGAIGAQLLALARFDFAGFKAISEAVKEDGQRARLELDAFERRLMAAGRAGQTAMGSENDPRRGRGYQALPEFTPRPNSGETAARQQISEAEKYIQRLNEATVAALDLSQVEQARIAIATGRLGKLTEAQEQQILSLADGLDKLREQRDFVGPEIPDDVLRAREEQAKAIDRLITASTGARFDALVGTAEALIQAFNAGQLSATDYARAIETLGKEFQALEPQAEQALTKVSTFAEEASRNVQDALGDTLTSVLRGDFETIGDLWEDLLIRMVAQAAAAQLNQYLFGTGVGTGGGVLGPVLGSLFGGFRAAGGPVQPGRAYVVGERGPEIIVPSSAGTVVPNAGMGGVSINYGGVTIGDNLSRAEVMQGLETMRRRTLTDVRDMLARNGMATA